MDILMVAAELGPYVRESPAADSIASLGKALRQLGHDVTIALPRYPGFEAAGLLVARRLTPLPLPGGGEVTVFDGQLSSGVGLALFDAPVLYDRPGVYGEDGKDYPDNAKRFGLLCQAAAALVRQRVGQGQAFDVLHLHDWPAALLPVALRRTAGPAVPAVLTIHDVTRQGSFSSKELDALGVPRELNTEEGVKLGTRVNALKGGIVFADTVTTVSPSYAREMQTEERAGALAAVLAGKPIVGICDGIDYAVHNPATDPAIVSRYDAEDTANKGRSKSALLAELGLEMEVDRPLVIAVGEPSKSAGFDLVAAALPTMLKNDLAFVVAGRGQGTLAKRLVAAKSRYADRYAFVEDPDEALVHRLYAAADIVLVPSRHEPCGVSQLVAQRYGAAPVARATGGILDTVVDCDAHLETGTGFLFDEDTPQALAGALARAVAACVTPAWGGLRRRMMRLDLGWDRPARRYLQVFRQTLGATAAA